MIERIFVGWKCPVLPEAARVLQERFAGSAWDMAGVYVVVSGAQAARRLGRILHDAALVSGAETINLPEIITPATLSERCCPGGGRMATPAEARFAWMAACAGLSEDDRRRLAPTLSADTDGAMAWAGVAAQAHLVRDSVAAECLTLSAVAAQCRSWGEAQADRRWEALARLEEAYLRTLAASGLADGNQTRLQALTAGTVACDRAVCLVGVQDLNGLERAMLSRLTSPVCAIIPAPEEERDGFDELGGLRAAAWHDRPIPIPDTRLHFVGGPAEEANKLADLIAALGGRYAREEITVGVGDETAAEGLELRLAAAGLPTVSPFGRPVDRTRPAALLGLACDYLRDPSACRFAALVRHPDFECWLEARLSEALPVPPDDEVTTPFLSSLDLFLAECLPGRLPETARCPGAGGTALDNARRTVCAGRDAVETFFLPLRSGTRPLASWAEPIADLLRVAFAAEPVGDDSPDGRQFRRGLEVLASILGGMKRLPSALAPVVPGHEALGFVLAEAAAHRLPSDADAGLEMMGWLELPLDDAPVLLLTGLHEGCVPKNSGDDPLLPDSLRARLGLADDRRRQARDAFLLRVLLESRPEMHVVTARRGADSGPKMPSRLLFACDARAAAGRARRFARPDDGGPHRPLFVPGGERRLAPLVPAPAGLRTLRVTGFRDYLCCPYRFYLRHVLRLDAPDDAHDEMDSRLFGILLHDCLDGFARSDASDCADPDRVRDFLRGELRRQAGRRFGGGPSRLLQLQIRQAGRRLDVFADWQAQSVRDGWRIEPDLAEQDMTALLVVDDQDFVITGRPDRVDYHPDRGFRIIDYKTGDSGKGPDERHRVQGEDGLRWIDLQLPLYRRLMEAQGKPVAPGESGYVLLSADLTPLTEGAQRRCRGGSGFDRACWTEDDHRSALQCAEGVVRNLRAGVFWPPTDPPPFPPSRTDLGRSDSHSGLCLDSSADRAEWLGLRKGKVPQDT